jgi:hypothetical protein
LSRIGVKREQRSVPFGTFAAQPWTRCPKRATNMQTDVETGPSNPHVFCSEIGIEYEQTYNKTITIAFCFSNFQWSDTTHNVCVVPSCHLDPRPCFVSRGGWFPPPTSALWMACVYAERTIEQENKVWHKHCDKVDTTLCAQMRTAGSI